MLKLQALRPLLPLAALALLAACGAPAETAAPTAAPATVAPAAEPPAAAATTEPPTATASPAVAAIAPTVTAAGGPYAGIPQSRTPEGYHVLGAADAPVTLVMYSDFL